LIYLAGIAKGIYLPTYPVYLVGEEPEQHQFVVAFGDEEARLVRAAGPNVVDLREYIERVTRERLRQPVFRSRVLVAYERRCALCRLAHPELLDAAHIRGDADGGQPVVTNGIAMCKLHHGAYDNQIVGIDPNYRIAVRHDVLEEIDGPTLRHSIQALQGETIALPSQRAARPDRDALAERFDIFQRAG
jgi:putative restriction endonuclease